MVNTEQKLFSAIEMLVSKSEENKENYADTIPNSVTNAVEADQTQLQLCQLLNMINQKLSGTQNNANLVNAQDSATTTDNVTATGSGK